MSSSIKPPIWFWVIGVLALLWNLFGLYNFYISTFDQVAILETLNQEQRELFEAIPLWATICFGIATISAVVASIGLLARKKWAKPLFIISLITLVAQFVNWLFIQNAPEVFPNSYAMPTTVFIVGVLLILFSNKGIQKSWLR
ncbi:hypothetical protein [Flagellimonas sp.]|uniref:hypothetical protein n=1 Tax=Flagellimonas sp. TaxID=2058762 RepID=UPI003F4A1998